MKEKIITKKILKWYDLNKRSLPWRKKLSPQKKQYYTLVSEFMLQQTQVVTVIPYFNKFIKNLHSINKLANVKEKTVSVDELYKEEEMDLKKEATKAKRSNKAVDKNKTKKTTKKVTKKS